MFEFGMFDPMSLLSAVCSHQEILYSVNSKLFFFLLCLWVKYRLLAEYEVAWERERPYEQRWKF
jgi:hypothetical protein